jgi:hypothetical protein
MKKLVSLTRAFTFGMAALSIPALALAQATFVEIGDRGEIIGEGTAAAIPVKVACPEDITYSASLVVGVEQRIDREAAGGSGRQDIKGCNRTSQTVKVVVTAGTGLVNGRLPDRNLRFREGTARAHAYLLVRSPERLPCEELNFSRGECSLLQDSEAIQLVK